MEVNPGDDRSDGHGYAEEAGAAVRGQVEDRVDVAPRVVRVQEGVAADVKVPIVRNGDDFHPHRRLLRSPTTDRVLHAARAAGQRDVVVRGTDVDAAPRRVVVPVARRRIVVGDVLAVNKVGRPGIQRRIEVVAVNLDALEHVVTGFADGGERVLVLTGERVDLRTRPEVRLLSVESRGVGIRAVDAEVLAVGRQAIVRAKGLGEGVEPVLEPTLSDLVQAAVLDAVHVLADHGVLVVAGEPFQPAATDVARGRAYRIAVVIPDRTVVLDGLQVTHDHVGRFARLAGVVRLSRNRQRKNEQRQH